MIRYLDTPCTSHTMAPAHRAPYVALTGMALLALVTNSALCRADYYATAMPAISDVTATVAGVTKTVSSGNGAQTADPTAPFSRTWTWNLDYPGEIQYTPNFKITAQTHLSAISATVTPDASRGSAYVQLQGVLSGDFGYVYNGSGATSSNPAYNNIPANNVVIDTTGSRGGSNITVNGSMYSYASNSAGVTVVGATAAASSGTATIGSPYIAKVP